MGKKPKIIVIVGPTASGKSALAIELAQKFNGEVVSADSRQVYSGLNIGTGKVTKKEMRNVPHHLLDIASPKRRYTVADYKRDAEKAIADIHSQGKIAIVCGGTGFYIQAIVDNIILPDVKPNTALRKRLQSKSRAELFRILKKLDPKRARAIDQNNPHRLIRAIEIATALGKVPQLKSAPKYEALQIGIRQDPEELREKIETRLEARLKKGMIAEAKKLHAGGLSWKRMEELGLEYRYLSRHLRGQITQQEMIKALSSEIWHYAKRQMTWLKRDTRIMWVRTDESSKISKKLKSFLADK